MNYRCGDAGDVDRLTKDVAPQFYVRSAPSALFWILTEKYLPTKSFSTIMHSTTT